MISGRVQSQEELEKVLREAGFEPTEFRTATGRIWRSTKTGMFMQVPDPYDGMYPDAILRGLIEVADLLGRPTLH